MKKLLLLITAVLLYSGLQAQDITGQWIGVLKVQGMQIRLIFHINKTDTGYTATMDSPDQGANGIPVPVVSYHNPSVQLGIPVATIEYKGSLVGNDSITGTFSQSGHNFPLGFKHDNAAVAAKRRPQDPVKPYPYITEEVRFLNPAAGIHLAGSLTLPEKEGSFPAVVLITGSGPQNRDEELMGHRPFLVLSDYLTRHHIAVLRVDDRGTAASEGVFKTANTQDFATDVEAAVQYLLTRKEIDHHKIGLIGHSEGGIIAPIVAVKDPAVQFIVLMAGTAVPGDELLLKQNELISRGMGASDSAIAINAAISKQAFSIVKESKDTIELETKLTAFFQRQLKLYPAEKPAGESDSLFVRKQVKELASPWLRYFIPYDPSKVLEKVTCPVLAINGSKDLQVPPSQNLPAIRAALTKGGNQHFSIVELPGLNHLFQECKSGIPAEYASIDQTIAPIALETMANWIAAQTK